MILLFRTWRPVSEEIEPGRPIFAREVDPDDLPRTALSGDEFSDVIKDSR